jgi:hypothetical protein
VAAEENGYGNADLQAGQGGTQAIVDAGPEGDVLADAPAQREPGLFAEGLSDGPDPAGKQKPERDVQCRKDSGKLPRSANGDRRRYGLTPHDSTLRVVHWSATTRASPNVHPTSGPSRRPRPPALG